MGWVVEPHDFAVCRCVASLWLRRRARASHLAVISALDLANGQGGGLGLAHRLESSSIVGQKALCVWRKVIETTELGHHEPSCKIRLGFVRAFLAILVLELEDMVVRLVRPSKLVNVHGDRWTVRMSGFGSAPRRRGSLVEEDSTRRVVD
jgi:hypothetical protein